jgi:hypothetical protein
MTQGKFVSVTFAYQGCRWSEIYELRNPATFQEIACAFSFGGRWTDLECADSNIRLLDDAVVEFRLLEG